MHLRSSHARTLLRALALGAVLVSACTGPLAPAPRVYRIGYVAGGTQATGAPQEEALRQALRDLGYVEGRNLDLEVRWAEGNESQSALVADLVTRSVDVIVVRGPAAALAAKQATTTIPIVLAGTVDPVGSGLVSSLAQPGGNITGAAGPGAELTGKRLQLLKETIPGTSRVAILVDTSATSVASYREAQRVAPGLGIEVIPLEVRGPEDFADALPTAGRGHADALLVTGSALFAAQEARILDLAAASRLPAIQGGLNRSFVDRGGLIFYGEDVTGTFKRAASYVDRILKGAKPADLPIETPTKLDLIINLKTAKALGLTIPPSVLAQATELIR